VLLNKSSIFQQAPGMELVLKFGGAGNGRSFSLTVSNVAFLKVVFTSKSSNLTILFVQKMAFVVRSKT